MKQVSIRKALLVALAVFNFSFANAQSGCTDPAATNYNSGATINDGSCVYPVTHNTPVLRAALSTDIHESSGLELTGGNLWTHNDSGNPAIIYKIDSATGHTLQVVYIDNYPNTDWEDITADSNYIYMGNFGNNNGTRTDLAILKVAKSDITSADTVHLDAQAIFFSYTDQTSFVSSKTNNFDCESVISLGDSLYIFTKDRGDLQTRVYKLPKTPGTYAVSPYAGYDVDGLITGADYDPITGEIVLIGYMSGHVNSFMWFLDDYEGDMFFSGNKRRIEIGGSAVWQTEGVCFISPGRFFISCESAGSIPASLFVSSESWLSAAVTTYVTSIATNEMSCFPNPVTGMLHIDKVPVAAEYRVADMSGAEVQRGLLQPGDNRISVSSLAPGAYMVQITGGETTQTMKMMVR